jgi:hypothetical protein
MAITKEEILAKCSSELIASRDCHAIAEAVSVGRTKPSSIMIGNGTIIAALNDLTAANALLDVLHNDARFKYVVPLLDQGRLIISDQLVVHTLQSFVPSILTQAQADKLIALATTPDPVSFTEVAEALYNADGSIK